MLAKICVESVPGRMWANICSIAAVPDLGGRVAREAGRTLPGHCPAPIAAPATLTGFPQARHRTHYSGNWILILRKRDKTI